MALFNKKTEAEKKSDEIKFRVSKKDKTRYKRQAEKKGKKLTTHIIDLLEDDIKKGSK